MYSKQNELLLWRVVGYCYEVQLQIWCKLVTLFDSYSYAGVSAGIWVIHTGLKFWGELVTLFDSYSYDGVSACIWVIHTEVENLEVSC